jgi:hypothetical protein
MAGGADRGIPQMQMATATITALPQKFMTVSGNDDRYCSYVDATSIHYVGAASTAAPMSALGR